eukprot:UN28355
MDLGNQRFDNEFYKFRKLAKALETQLAHILDEGFNEIPDVQGRFKLIQSLEGLITRPLIKDSYEKNQQYLAARCLHDLRLVDEQFEADKENPPLHRNLPLRSGALLWATSFRIEL